MGLEISVEAERESEDFFLRPKRGDHLCVHGAQPCQGLGMTSTRVSHKALHTCEASKYLWLDKGNPKAWDTVQF